MYLQLWFQAGMSDYVLLGWVGVACASGECGPGSGLAGCVMGCVWPGVYMCVCLAKCLSGSVCACVSVCPCVLCERDGGGVSGSVCVCIVSVCP